MNKKMNILAVLPFYGSIILLIMLFIKYIKKMINKKQFNRYFYGCGFFGGISVFLLILFVRFLNYQFNFSDIQLMIAESTAMIIAGYIMNLFTFILLNKKWEKLLTNTNKNEQS